MDQCHLESACMKYKDACDEFWKLYESIEDHDLKEWASILFESIQRDDADVPKVPVSHTQVTNIVALTKYVRLKHERIQNTQVDTRPCLRRVPSITEEFADRRPGLLE